MRLGVIIIGALTFWLSSCNNASTIKFTNVVCENYNKSLTLIHECRLRAINRNKTIINFNATVLHPIYNIVLDGRILKKENGYKPWLYKFNIDACQFMKNPYNPVAIIFYKMLKPYTNVNHTCPYVGPMIVKGFQMQYEMLRLPWPSGEFLWALNWISNNKRQFATNVYWTVNET